MRAHWLKELSIQESYVLRDESLHHLVNVIRIEVGEELLLLDGKGLFVKTLVDNISKKELRLKFISSEIKERAYSFDLALGMPKRDALELCLKEATELGFRKIFLIKSQYSQMRMPESERIEKLLVSALEQSNASYLPECLEITFEEIDYNRYSEALLLDSQTKTSTSVKGQSEATRLLIVGPEGGFSPSELTFLHSQENVRVLNLPTPIMRTPTALAAGAGILLESLLK